MTVLGGTLFTLALGALFAFGVWKNTFHSPASRVALSALRVGALGLLGLNLVARWAPQQPATRNLDVWIERRVVEQRGPRARAMLEILGMEKQGWTPRVAVLGKGEPGGGVRLPEALRSAPVFRDLEAAALWGGSRGAASPPSVIAILSRRPPSPARVRRSGLEERDLYWVDPFPPAKAPSIFDFQAPERAFVGTDVPVRVHLRRAQGGHRLILFGDGRRLEEKALEPVTRGSPLVVEFDPVLFEAGDRWFRVDLLDPDGRVIDRRVTGVTLTEKPRVVYFARREAEAPLAALLEAQGYPVDRVDAADLPGGGAAELAAGDLAVLDEVSPRHLRPDVVAQLAESVAVRGAAVVSIPGTMRMGPYRDTVFEGLLPVRIGPAGADARGKKAFVAVIDTSMSMRFYPHGVNKIDMVKKALLNLAFAVEPGDAFGILGVSESPHWILKPDQPHTMEAAGETVRRIYAFDGGINLYSGLLEAFQQIRDLDAELKHILFMVDTADVDEYAVAGVGDVWELVDRLHQFDVSMSIIGFGTGRDTHIPFLNQLAERSGGYFYLSSALEEIPAFALQDLEEVTENPVIRRPMKVLSRSARFPGLGAFPSLEGLVLSSAKPAAEVLAWSEAGNPVFARYRLGRGAVSVFLGDSGVFLAPAWAEGELAARVWEQLLPLASSGRREGVRFSWEKSHSGVQLALRIPPDAAQSALSSRLSGEGQGVEDFPLWPLGPREYGARFQADGQGSALVQVVASGGEERVLEFLPAAEDSGKQTQDASDALHETLAAAPETAAAVWRNPEIQRLVLLLVLGFFVLEEIFRPGMGEA